MIYRTNAITFSTPFKMSSKFIRRTKAIVRYCKLYYVYKKNYYFIPSQHDNFWLKFVKTYKIEYFLLKRKKHDRWLKFVEVHEKIVPSKHLLMIEEAAIKDKQNEQ